MKKNPNYQNRLLLGCLATALAVGTQARADFDPIPLTPGSFTADVVVEKTAAPPINAYTTATMDGGTNNNSWTWYEQGYVASWPNTGIPKQGVTFEAITDGSHSFKMAPDYAANNVILVFTNGSPTGTLTVTAPAAYTALSFLVASGGGPGSFNYVIHYQGGGTQPGSLAVPDWFNNTAAGIAWNANGRVQTDGATFGNLNNTTPNLFFVDLPLTDTANPVTSIEFLGTSPNRTLVFAVSGQNLGGSYVPMTVTGYNRDMVVEAATPVRSFLLHATTVTMEGSPGNNYGNAWYERGFNPYSTNSGLPPANSTFSTLTNGAHTFRMAPTYATNNVMYMGNFGTYNFGTFTLATPAAYNALSFLATAASGPVEISANVTFEDFSIETVTFAAPDWFNQPNAVLNVNGRVNTENAGLDTRTDNNPRVYG
ncbi:MAG TPA: hypothetical protein VN673_17130, partial [Clostridia bacterium]|nr:hypothetical protein [Clostridia bacterium]